MLTIINAYTQRGWDACDHLIDDSRLDEIVGQSYSNRANMLRAARARADRRGFVAVEYRDSASGETWLIGDEPNLPGRPRLCRRVE